MNESTGSDKDKKVPKFYPATGAVVAVLLVATVVQSHLGEYSPLVRAVIGGVVALVVIGLAFALGKCVGTARNRR